MSRALLTKKAAGVALVGAVVIGGTAAYAYPPGTSMSTSVSTGARDNGEKGTRLTVNVSNSNPDCGIKFDVNEVEKTVAPGHPVHFSQILDIKSTGGRHSITVKTQGCGGAHKESVKTSFNIVNAKLFTKSDTVKVKKQVEFKVTGFPAKGEVTFVATKGGGTPADTMTSTKTANSEGEAKTKFTFPTTGTWTVVATAAGVGSGQATQTTVTVQ